MFEILFKSMSFPKYSAHAFATHFLEFEIFIDSTESQGNVLKVNEGFEKG